MVKPEDTFEMEISATTKKESLTNNLVPKEKHARKIYGIFLNNRDPEERAGITFTIESGDEVERTLPEIIIPPNGTIDISRPVNSPIITIKGGQNIKAQVTTGRGPVSVILSAYDV